VDAAGIEPAAVLDDVLWLDKAAKSPEARVMARLVLERLRGV
jgi:hypothetical protein